MNRDPLNVGTSGLRARLSRAWRAVAPYLVIDHRPPYQARPMVVLSAGRLVIGGATLEPGRLTFGEADIWTLPPGMRPAPGVHENCLSTRDFTMQGTLETSDFTDALLALFWGIDVAEAGGVPIREIIAAEQGRARGHQWAQQEWADEIPNIRQYVWDLSIKEWGQEGS